MISSIRIQNFRSYGDASFEFEPGVNIIVGPNASGKTNLLEAVLMLASGSSYRARDAEMIQFNKPWARLDGFFGHESRILKLVNEGDILKKEYIIDDKSFKRLTAAHSQPVVYFEPNHLLFITRGPKQRREYIDDLLGRCQPGFKSLSANYRRTLAQRNALLKKGSHVAVSQLFAWNIRLSELGSKIVAHRLELIESINKSISANYSKIAAHKSNVRLDYSTNLDVNNYSSQLLKKLEASSQDLAFGFTAHGPHREDIIFYLNGQPVNQTASRGEARSLVLALKTLELNLIEGVFKTKPIFLLDDVFSELDSARRSRLVDHLKDHQVIITTTDADAVLEHFLSGPNIIAL